MRTDPQLWTTRHVLALAHSSQAGLLVRTGRQALGWRQADFGRRLLCSQSAVSRLEQGHHPDLRLLRRAATEVGVPLELLALSLGLRSQPGPRVADDPSPAQEDPMRRRSLITAAALAAPSPSSPPWTPRLHPPRPPPAPLPTLSTPASPPPAPSSTPRLTPPPADPARPPRRRPPRRRPRAARISTTPACHPPTPSPPRP